MIAGFSVNIEHLQFALVFIMRIFVFFSCFSIILVRLRLLSQQSTETDYLFLLSSEFLAFGITFLALVHMFVLLLVLMKMDAKIDIQLMWHKHSLG